MIQLRIYQRAALDALIGYFYRNSGHPILVLPTGAGKSVIIAVFAQEVLQAWPNQRILVLAHVKELVGQNASKLFDLWPEAPAGIYSAGMNRRDVGDAITFASIQSVFRRSADLGRYDLILVDEAHLIPPSSAGMYRTFIADQEKLNPNVKIIGLTATAFRMGQGMLHESKGSLFTDIAYEVTIAELLAGGYLAPLTTTPVRERLKVAGVEKRNGEFVPGALEAAVDKTEVTAAACNEIIELGADRRAWLVFCSGIRHAQHVRDELAQRVPCALVTGDTPTAERDRLIKDYHAGRIRALVNVDVLTTGFDAPQTDLIAFLRPTQSPGLYVQMAGRGMRIAEGKVDALVLDFAGNIARHGPVDDVRPPRAPGARGAAGEAPSKSCPKCKAKMHPKAAYCADCGYTFPVLPQHEAAADDRPIMRGEREAERYEAVTVSYTQHNKYNSPPILRADYYAGIRRVATDWVCLEHEGYARTKARIWWRKRANAEPPTSIEEALQLVHTLKTPSAILVDERGKYPEILAHEFEEPDASRESAGTPNAQASV